MHDFEYRNWVDLVIFVVSGAEKRTYVVEMKVLYTCE